MKSNSPAHPGEMVLSEGDYDKIGDTIQHITRHLWGNIEEQYRGVLVEVHKILKELQVQTSAVQESMLQASGIQVRGASTNMSTIGQDLKITTDIHAV